MTSKAVIILFFLLAGVVSLSAKTNTTKKTNPTVKKDSLTLAKPDTTKGQSNVLFPNPFILFQTEQSEYK